MFKSRLGRIALILVSVILMTGTVYAAGQQEAWPSAGHDLQNTRNQSSENKIKPKNVNNLVVKWQFTTGGDVSATAAVDDSAVYFPDWAGNPG
jgi:polyvinyl alcohol dehydrogenase (cytochrome)